MLPRLYRGTYFNEQVPEWAPQPYMAGYMETGGNYFGVKKIKTTVSFPDTNASVIQTDNWLAGGMFATGYEGAGGHEQIDYGYYTMLTLDHNGNLCLDFGVNQTYECLRFIGKPLPHGVNPWTKGLFNATVPIDGVSHSTPITMTASWDNPQSGWVSWEYTVNDVTYPAGAANVAELAECSMPGSHIQHQFIVGSRNVLPIPFATWLAYWQTYNFQFGVISQYSIDHGGWNVLLSNPSYFKEGK